MTDLIPASDLTLIRALVERVGEMEVTDSDSNQMASAALRDIKTMREQIEKRVTQLRKPHMDAANRISSEAKPYLEELKDGEQHLRGIVTAYMVEQARMVKEEEEARETRLALAQTSEEVEEALVTLTVPVERDWRPAGVSLQTRWKAEVTDFPALVKWVVEGYENDFGRFRFLMDNRSALGDEARAVKGPSPIPGVRFYSESAVAASAR